MNDPWAIQQWAFKQVTGSPTRKAIFSALATMADMTTGRCQASQETLAQWAEVTDRSVRGHLKGLIEAGLIAQRHQYRLDGSRRNSEFLLLAPGITEWPDGAPVITGNMEHLPEAERRANRKPTSGQEQPLKNNHSFKGTTPPPPDAEIDKADQPIEWVWAHYQLTFPTGAKQRTLDPTRRKVIANALKVRDVSRVCDAISGLATSEHHVSNGYTDIRYALKGKPRDGESVEDRIDGMAERCTAAKQKQSVAPGRYTGRKRAEDQL